jgi:xanthine dehydrogenase YagT iron-sulfur-binding subunit
MSAQNRVDTKEPDGTSIPVSLRVNGKAHTIQVDPRMTLLDCLREMLHLTGTKKGCDHGQCGACTVHVDGRRTNSCLALAAIQDGREVTTIEGLGSPGNLHPMQAAFLEHDAYQCGYCTSGQIMSAVALLAEPCGPSDDDVREFMSGNICRCGAYPNIVAAIQHVRRGQGAGGKPSSLSHWNARATAARPSRRPRHRRRPSKAPACASWPAAPRSSTS